jgi:hypothetical protein
MTDEDEIIQAVAELLHESREDEYTDIRRSFWINGRCEHCGKPRADSNALQCESCGGATVSRSNTSPGKKVRAPIAQWWDIVPPGDGAAFPILVVANRVALAWATCGLFSVFDRWDDARKALEEHKFVCTKAPP